MSKRRTRFITWAKRDPDDETPIDYTFKTHDGVVHLFTSDDELDIFMFRRVQNAWIQSIELVDGTWKAVLYEEGE